MNFGAGTSRGRHCMEAALFPCVLVGDSIAVGVGQYRPDCETVAQVGITSDRYIATLLPGVAQPGEAAIISLGVNDDETEDTLTNLRTVRARFQGKTVYWLLPGLKEPVRQAIRTVAQENGDRLIDTRPQAGPDHLHPTGQGYRMLAGQIDGGPEEYAALAPAPDQHRRPHGLLTPAQRIRNLRALREREWPPVRHSRIQRPADRIHLSARMPDPVPPRHPAARATTGHWHRVADIIRRCPARACRTARPAPG